MGLRRYLWPKTREEWQWYIKIWAVTMYLFPVIQGAETLLVLCKRAHPAIECQQGINGTQSPVKQQLDTEYIFYYLGCYGVIGVLRIIQFIQLGNGLWKLAKGLDKEMAKAFNAARHAMCCPCMWMHMGKRVLLLLMMLTAIVYFALGVANELDYAYTLTCLHHNIVPYMFSNLFNLATHSIYIAVLVLMMGAGTAMEHILFPSQQNRHRIPYTCCYKYTKLYSQHSLEDGLTPENLQERYNENGRRIRLLNKVFQGWFLLPVIVVLIKMHMPHARSRLSPWVVNNHASLMTVFYEIVHLVYQILLPIIQIDNAKAMIAVNKKYIRKLKSVGPVQEDVRNYLIPKIGSTDIPVNNVLAIYVTLIGLMIVVGQEFLDLST